MGMTADINAEVRELAAKTAAEIRRRGWVQGKLMWIDNPLAQTAEDCRVCVVGAVNAAAHGSPLYYTPDDDPFVYLSVAERELYARIADAVVPPFDDEGWSADYPHPDLAVLSWNDEQGRTVDDVLRVLDNIADTATQSAEAA